MTFFCALLSIGPALVWGALVFRLAGAHGRLGSLEDVEVTRPGEAALLLAGVVISSAVLAGTRGGFHWQRTFYRLSALRQGCVRERDWPACNAVGW